MSAPKKINLLVREGFENSTAGKILAWGLSAGRTIVIVTELIVIVAFLSRFWLDRNLADLNDQNNIKKLQVESSLQFETDFRNLQNRLLAYKTLTATNINGAGIVKTLAQNLPSDVSLTGVFLNSGKLSLQGSARSEAGLAGFLKALEQNNKFTKIKLADLSLEGPDKRTLGFKIEADLGKK